jgi:hypothetical protein
MSAPALSTASTSSPNREKSADSMDGAILYSVIVKLGFSLNYRNQYYHAIRIVMAEKSTLLIKDEAIHRILR